VLLEAGGLTVGREAADVQQLSCRFEN
jgi:hypothetical protein